MTTNKKAFQKKAEKYADAMIRGDYEALGGEGLKALRQITNYAGLPADVVAGGNSTPAANIPIPGVTETDAHGRERHYDLLSLLLNQRIVLLAGEVNPSMALIASASLLYLDKVHSGASKGAVPGEPIKVIIDSPGGSVHAGLGIYDVMQGIHSPIQTIGVGMEASMGSVFLAAGGERIMTPYAQLMIHQISYGGKGQATDISITKESAERMHEVLKDIYVSHIGLNHDFWDIVMERDTWLSAEQALKMGFITEIDAIPENKKAPFAKDILKRKFQKAQEREAQVPKSLSEIESVINNGSANGSKWSPIRAELVVALSQYPKYWTEGKKEKMAAEGYVVPADDVMFTGAKIGEKTAQSNVIDLASVSKKKSNSKKQDPSA